jgi:hypothetical protein
LITGRARLTSHPWTEGGWEQRLGRVVKISA